MLRRNSKQGVAARGLRLLLAFYFCWTAAARANDNADLLNVVVGDQDLFGANDAPGLLDEAIVEDERAFFLKHDVDGDGKLNFDEFNKHWEESTGLKENGGSGEGGSSAESLEDNADALFGFNEFDHNNDGKVGWEEWQAALAPEEGYEVAHLQRLFRDWDRDRDGRLAKSEIIDMLMHHSDEEAGEGEGLIFSKDEIDMVTWQLLDDKDGDGDGKLTREEWLAGAGFLLPPKEESPFLQT